MGAGQREYELRGGRIILHTRASDRHGTWQCRLRLGTGRTLIRRSARTTDLAEAKRTAEELYDELSYKQKNNELLRDRTFKQLADEYLRKAERETIEGRLSKGRLGLVAGTLRRYLVPFFGKRLLNEITAADFNEYDDWRLDYWTRGYGAEKRVATCAKTPSAKTLLMEQGILRQVLKYGLELGLLKHMPFMRTKTAKTNRRSAFDVGEYAKLIRAAHRRAELEQHSRVKRDRKLLELYLRLMVGTGLRVGEARGLKWSDVEFINTGNRKQTETLRLWVDGKTGRRAVIGTRAAKQTIKKLLGFYEFENIDAARLTGTALFTKVSGKARHTFELGFKALLEETGLTWDRYSKRRTLYSLRHTYATFRLLYGGTDIYLLSRNMGTSVEMIEKHYGQVRTTLAAAALI